MYDTSVRVLTPVNTLSTNENVGPSTYVLCKPPCKKQNVAPFLSSKTKEPSFITKLNTHAIYDAASPRHHIKGGSSMRNKAPRFVYKIEDLPEPPTPKPIQWVKKKLKLDPTKPKLYVCPVPYSITCTAPTIPTKIDENGYDIDPDGNIIKVPPDEPEFIDLEIKSFFPGNKGWRWSCRSSRRFSEKQKSLGPGPAAHSVQLPKCKRREEEELVREMARRLGYVPRYIEAQAAKICREGLPGPGYYDLTKPPSDHRAKSIYPRPFIAQAPRFKHADTSDTPAPDKYKICDCYRVQKQFSVKCAPFGFEAPRFKHKRLHVTPGPGDYEIKSALREKLESKKNPYALFTPPFNTTAERKSPFITPTADWVPSPAAYPEDKEDEEEEGLEISSSVFMCAVERFRVIDKKYNVSPARYDVASSFEKTRCRKSFNVAGIPFCFSGPRSLTPTFKTDVPCPTSYKNQRGLRHAGYHFNISPRFEEEREESPGPGTYMIHPRFEVATYKARDTHNLKLKENVLRKRLKLAPRETRKQWRKELKKHKLLRWFDVGLDPEERLALFVQVLFDDNVPDNLFVTKPK